MRMSVICAVVSEYQDYGVLAVSVEVCNGGDGVVLSGGACNDSNALIGVGVPSGAELFCKGGHLIFVFAFNADNGVVPVHDGHVAVGIFSHEIVFSCRAIEHGQGLASSLIVVVGKHRSANDGEGSV